MSNRVLKKLYCEKDLAASLGVDGMSESDDGGPSQASGAVRKQIAHNRFELLNSIDHSLSDTEAKEDDDRENEPPQEGQERNRLEKQDSTHSTDSLKRRKKKKKKKLKSQKSTEENLDDAEDEIEASIQEINKLIGEPEVLPDAYLQASSSKPSLEKSLLSVDLRNLNPDNEMRKLFGSKAIHEQVKRRGRGRGHGKSSVLVSSSFHLQHLGKPGLSMSLLESKGDVYYFTFEHSKQYQQIQHQFLEAVESYNPDNIMSLLNAYPYHIDALIQFSDICRMGEDAQMAAEMIERALYCMECCFHPLFNVAQGNCRLDYRRAENRSFYITIFKHLSYVGQRGCTRTALEFCKLLLSLDPDEDPLCVLLMIDYYALRSGQYDFLIKLYDEWNASRNLYQLPNFAFSVPLAKYLQAGDGNRSTAEADSMLQDAIIMFPGVLMPLLDKCSVQPDAQVSSHSYFNSRTSDPHALRQLQSLYIGRTYMLWKLPNTIFWLERNVQQVLQRINSNEPYVNDCEEMRKVRYKGMPQNILRHIILSNIKEATVTLPQDLRNKPIFSFDPLPPADSIVSYSRPSRPAPTENSGMLSVLLQSLLPSFSLRPEGDGAVAGAAAARDGNAPYAAEVNDLRRSMTSLLDAMRDLFSNIHLADVPNEGDVDSDEDREE